jgi:hypothetical protein
LVRGVVHMDHRVRGLQKGRHDGRRLDVSGGVSDSICRQGLQQMSFDQCGRGVFFGGETGTASRALLGMAAEAKTRSCCGFMCGLRRRWYQSYAGGGRLDTVVNCFPQQPHGSGAWLPRPGMIKCTLSTESDKNGRAPPQAARHTWPHTAAKLCSTIHTPLNRQRWPPLKRKQGHLPKSATMTGTTTRNFRFVTMPSVLSALTLPEWTS